MTITDESSFKDLSDAAKNIIENIPDVLYENSCSRGPFILDIKVEASIDDMIAAMGYFINCSQTVISPGTYYLREVLARDSSNSYHPTVCFFNSADEFRKVMRHNASRLVNGETEVIGRVKYDLNCKRKTSIFVKTINGREISLDGYIKATTTAETQSGTQYRLTLF